MTKDEAIQILAACKPLAERATTAFSNGIPLNYPLSQKDLEVLQGFARVQNDPIVAGPGLLNRLFAQAKLTTVEIYRLEQLRRLVFKRGYLGQDVVNGHKPDAR